MGRKHRERHPGVSSLLTVETEKAGNFNDFRKEGDIGCDDDGGGIPFPVS